MILLLPHRPPATLALIGVSTALYVAVFPLGLHSLTAPLLISEYTRPLLPEIRDGQLWRLVTPVFLHFGIFHIVFNMLWTWELGRLIESRHGALGLLGLTALIGVASNLCQYAVDGPWFGGMSGVIYGYFGYLWMQGVFNPAFGMRLRRPVVYLLLGWLALCWSGVLEALFDLRVANTAHTIGLISGIVLAFAFIGVGRWGRA